MTLIAGKEQDWVSPVSVPEERGWGNRDRSLVMLVDVDQETSLEVEVLVEVGPARLVEDVALRA